MLILLIALSRSFWIVEGYTRVSAFCYQVSEALGRVLAYGMVLKAVSTATNALLLLLEFLRRESLYQGRILRASSSRAAAFGCWTGVFAQYLLQMMLIHEPFLDVIAANLVTVILDSGDCCLHLALLLLCIRVVNDG